DEDNASNLLIQRPILIPDPEFRSSVAVVAVVNSQEGGSSTPARTASSSSVRTFPSAALPQQHAACAFLPCAATTNSADEEKKKSFSSSTPLLSPEAPEFYPGRESHARFNSTPPLLFPSEATATPVEMFSTPAVGRRPLAPVVLGGQERSRYNDHVVAEEFHMSTTAGVSVTVAAPQTDFQHEGLQRFVEHEHTS
ncbi:unnamed protein product, partial [Amoebophrya sp. A120]